MEKTNHILKGLGYAYIITLAILLIYNLLLTFTELSAESTAMVASSITTLSSAFGGFYAAKHIKEKGLLYGMLVGILYIMCLVVIVFLAQENFTFANTIVYKTFLITAAGGIGGVLGVNFK
jgi:putative membrane protein (TIGR04086 family)